MALQSLTQRIYRFFLAETFFLTGFFLADPFLAIFWFS
jgi:hypothetical protein